MVSFVFLLIFRWVCVVESRRLLDWFRCLYLIYFIEVVVWWCWFVFVVWVVYCVVVGYVILENVVERYLLVFLGRVGVWIGIVIVVILWGWCWSYDVGIWRVVCVVRLSVVYGGLRFNIWFWVSMLWFIEGEWLWWVNWVMFFCEFDFGFGCRVFVIVDVV